MLIMGTPPTVLCNRFETLQVFCHGLKVFMLFGYNLQIIFSHVFGISNLIIFQVYIDNMHL